MELILASASPRRAEILRNAGFVFEIRPAGADETLFAGETAEEYVRRLADTKARITGEYAAGAGKQAIVLGADTVVVARGQILGKPENTNEARRMLRLLSGRSHEVLTGVSFAVVPGGPRISHAEITLVFFAELSESDIDGYLATGEPFDKAGAYGIQGIGGRFVRRIEGCYFNVMGLPLSRVWSELHALGWNGATRIA